MCSCPVCCHLLDDQAGQLVDVEEIREKTQNKPKGLFHFNDAEGRKHRMVR